LTPGTTLSLVIFGCKSARVCCELQVQHLVDRKSPGACVDWLKKDVNVLQDDAFCVDSVSIPVCLVLPLFGSAGDRLLNLQRASGCSHVTIIGSCVFFSGSKDERERGSVYLKEQLVFLEDPTAYTCRQNSWSSGLHLCHIFPSRRTGG